MTQDTHRGLGGLLKGSLFILLGNIVGMGSSFAVRVIIGRYLGSTQYGLIIVGLTLVNTCSIIILFGFPEGISQRLPRSEHNGSIFSAAVLVSVSCGLVVGIFGVLFSGVLSQLINQVNASPVIYYFSISLPFLIFTKLSLGYIRGKSDVKGRVIIQNISLQTLLILFIGIAVLYNSRVGFVAQVWASVYIVSAIISSGYIYSRYDKLFPKTTLSETKDLLKFSFPLMISSTLWLMIQQSDNLILAYFHPASVVGRYDASFTIGRIILMATSALGFLFLPALSRLDSKGKNSELVGIYNQATKFLIFSTLPIFSLFISFPGEILSIFYGDSFTSASSALVILSIGFFTHSLLGNNGNGLTSIGLTRRVATGSLICFSINILLNIVLIPNLAELGASIASAISYIFVNIYYSYYLYNHTGINPLDKNIVKIIVTCLSIAFVFRYYTMFIKLPYSVLIVCTFEILVIISIVAIFGMRKEDWELIISNVNLIPQDD